MARIGKSIEGSVRASLRCARRHRRSQLGAVALALIASVCLADPAASATTGPAVSNATPGTNWTQQAELEASPFFGPADSFGASVDISGTTAIVGAKESAGAYIFTNTAGSWKQVATLRPNDGSGAVAISGSTVIAGGDPDTYVFTDSGGTWSQQGELVNPPKAVHNLFGDSVAVSGSTVVVGAEFNDHYRGSAYVFKHAKGSWIHAGKLVASDQRACFSTDEGRFCDDFGNSVAMSGTSIIVGSEGWGGQTGSAYVFVPAASAGDPSA
jgi:hypothetical protein